MTQIVFDTETIPDDEAIKSDEWSEYKARRQCEADSEAALVAPFARIVCICAKVVGKESAFSYASIFYEKEIIQRFKEFVWQYSDVVLVGHNIKAFDVPMLRMKMLQHRITPPVCLRTLNKKPWEMSFIDTCEVLRFGLGQRYSLGDVCKMLGMLSPKEYMSGKDVWRKCLDGRIEDVREYCMRDVDSTEDLWTMIQDNEFGRYTE